LGGVGTGRGGGEEKISRETIEREEEKRESLSCGRKGNGPFHSKKKRGKQTRFAQSSEGGDQITKQRSRSATRNHSS